MLGETLRGKNVSVIGLGIEGEDLARYFAGAGARVTVSDLKDAEALAARLQALQGLDIEFRLGTNDPARVRDADLVCISQGVPLTNPAVVAARQSGKTVENGTTLFLRHFPGPVVGITGSSGKTTTTSLVDAVFSAAGRRHVLGGNIGRGLLSLLDSATPETWALLEVSHTQLALAQASPPVAALLGVTPNHLDQFTWEEYVQLKRRIFAFQKASDRAVFNAEAPVVTELRRTALAETFLFGLSGDHGLPGAFLEDGVVWLRRQGAKELVIPADQVPLRGRHNLANVTAATAIAAACDISPDAVRQAVIDFQPPPHRLEFVTRVDQVDFFNDSIATTPERTLAGLRSFDQPVVLLLGGREKALPLSDLWQECSRRCRAIVCFGEAAVSLSNSARQAGLAPSVAGSLSQAVQAATSGSEPGDVVLLSPACTSFDAYANFEQRGLDFREIVSLLASESGS